MKNIVKFLLLIVYTTIIFFLPNNELILISFLINLFLIFIAKINIKSVFKSTFKILPFIIFTFIINCVLDEIENAIWIGIKLLIVCNITIIYSKTTTIAGVAKTIKSLCAPLKLLKINTDDIEVLVSISLSMIPILKKDLFELKQASKAKNMKINNLKNIKFILAKFLISIFIRVNKIEEALIVKGY